jgi:heat shock protein HslJ
MLRRFHALTQLVFVGSQAIAQPSPLPPLPLPFTATGNEPGWRVEITADRITLDADYGTTKLTMRAGAPQPVPGGRRYAGNADGRVLVVTVLDRLCEDDMTGMPRPQTVEVTMDEQALKGCGGDPAALLAGPAWVVEQLDTKGMVDGARVTLNFGSDGRLSGTASCNNYTATYALSGEGLTIGQAASTRKACAPPLMAQEQTFLAVLAAVNRFEIATDGALVLHANDGRTLRARR